MTAITTREASQRLRERLWARRRAPFRQAGKRRRGHSTRHASTPTARYYFELRKRAKAFRVDLASKQWCNLWHDHFDWNGLGDLSWEHRRRHLRVLLTVLTRALSELAGSPQPWQAFACIHPQDSRSDALYVHTPNPHGTDFPHVHAEHELGVLPPLLAGLVDLGRFRVLGRCTGDQQNYIVEPRGTAPT